MNNYYIGDFLAYDSKTFARRFGFANRMSRFGQNAHECLAMKWLPRDDNSRWLRASHLRLFARILIITAMHCD
jgi:hypothetical protein